jgi:cytochrome P450
VTGEPETIETGKALAHIRVDPRRFATAPLPVLAAMARRPERMILVEAGTQRFMLLNRPADAREFLALDGFGLAKSYGAVRYIIGDGILTSHGRTWQVVRERLQPAFQQDRLANMAPDIAAAFDPVIERWLADAAAADGKPVDVMRGLVRATLDVLLRVLAGSDGSLLNEGDIDAINQALLAASRHAWLRGASQRALMAQREPGFEAAVRRLDRVAERIYRHQLKRSDPAGAPDGDAVARLVAAFQDPDCPEMTVRQLRDELVTFLLVGHETTAVALAWTLWLLGSHPEIQAALRREAAGVDDGMTAKETLAAAPLASAVFREAMRLYPPIPVLPRIAFDSVKIGGARLHRGSFFALPVFVYQRDPVVWPEPKRFMPERFLGSDTSLRDSPSYMPFGAGPRACLGSRFALTEGPIGLLRIVRQISFRTANDRLVPIASAVTLRPEQGPHLRIGRPA